MIFARKMARLRLGIGAKVTILVSRLHPKDVISKAYPNYTKNDKVHGLVVVSEGPRSIRREEKTVVVFTHPRGSNRRFHLIVGRSIALPTSQKKGMNQGYSSHRLLQVTTILEQQGLQNPTPMSSPPPLPTHKNHNPTMNPCKQRCLQNWFH